MIDTAFWPVVMGFMAGGIVDSYKRFRNGDGGRATVVFCLCFVSAFLAATHWFLKSLGWA